MISRYDTISKLGDVKRILEKVEGNTTIGDEAKFRAWVRENLQNALSILSGKQEIEAAYNKGMDDGREEGFAMGLDEGFESGYMQCSDDMQKEKNKLKGECL